MNVHAISNSLGPYIQSLLGTAGSVNGTSTGTGASAAAALPQDGNPQLSPFAQLLTTLQQLQQSDPAKYQQVTAQIATNLQTAASTATANGNTSQGTQLNQLAADFTSASQNNTLPNIQDLAQAAAGGHGRHHHHPHHDGSGQPTPASDLGQQISAFLANATSSTQVSI